MRTGCPAFFRHHGLALVLFAAAATLFLWDVLLLDYSLGAFDIILNQPSWKGEFNFHGIHQPILSDSPAAHYPQREFDWGHVRQFTNGEFNPYIFTGMPWMPQGVGAFVTSLPQLFLDVANALDWTTWLRLVAAGFFMYLLVLELGLGRAAGVFAGVLWAYNLHQVVWLEFPQHLATQLWIPLLFALNLRLMNTGLNLLGAVALVAVNVLFFTSGYTQIVLYTYIAVGVLNTVHLAAGASGAAFPEGLRRWTAVHALYVAAVALCATGVLAEMSFISEGLRGAQDWRGRVGDAELSLTALAGFLKSLVPKLSEATQVLNPNYYGGIWSGSYDFENGNIVETARYFGVTGVLFAVAALFMIRGTEHARSITVFAVVTGIMFSLFYRNEITMGLFRLIPFADKGSYSRFITLLTFFGCVLAAYGFELALGARYRRLFLAVAVVAAVVLAAWGLEEEFRITRMWYPVVVAAIVGAAVLVGRRWLPARRWVGPLVIVVAFADLYAAGYEFNTRMDNDRLFPENNAIRFLLNDPEPYRVAVISDKPIYHPNVLSFYDIPVVEGYSTVLPVDYAWYIEELFPKEHVTRNGILFLFEPNVQALRLLNVKYVLSDEPLAEEYDGLTHVLDSNNHAIFRVEDSLPRVFCASDVLYAENQDEALEAYDKAIRDLNAPVVVEGDGARTAYRGDCSVDEIEVYTDRVTARVNTDSPRHLVVPYPFSDDWRARVNGQPRELARANGYHMALPLAAGESRVEITYGNRLNQAAAWVFVLAALGLLAYAWRSRQARGAARVALVTVALLVAFKSALTLPFVRGAPVPERTPPAERYEVLEQGVHRMEMKQHSDRVSRDNAVQYPLRIESRGLTRLAFLAGTFHQRHLEHPIRVEILDAGGNVLVDRELEGGSVFNNSWFNVNFPAIEKQTELSVRISTREPAHSRSFILWLDGDGDICVQSWYEWEAQES